MEGLVIRHAASADIDNILKLQKGLIAHHSKIDKFYGMLNGSRDRFLEYHKRSIRSRNRVLFVAYRDKKVIGYISGSIKKKSPHYAIKRVGIVDEIFVLAGYRRRGVANELFLAVKLWFGKRGLSVIEVEADSRNRESMSTWKALGFEVYTYRLKMSL